MSWMPLSVRTVWMKASAQRSRDHGFQGKLCIHPTHMSAIHQAFAPSVGEIAEAQQMRSEEHTSELQSLMRISYAVFCLKKKNHHTITTQIINDCTTNTPYPVYIHI